MQNIKKFAPIPLTVATVENLLPQIKVIGGSNPDAPEAT
jgi:hypothetical protein